MWLVVQVWFENHMDVKLSRRTKSRDFNDEIAVTTTNGILGIVDELPLKITFGALYTIWDSLGWKTISNSDYK